MKQKLTSPVPVLTLKQTRRVFGEKNVSYATVSKWAREGRLPAIKIGGRRFILREAFLALFKQPPERTA
jgi:excisionase family DNA binding protein